MESVESRRARAKPPTRGKLRVLRNIVVAMLRFFETLVTEDARLIGAHGRLFVGVTSTLIGVLSFSSDRYCDGNASVYAACTRPATYYYYPWWAVLLMVIGSLLILLWVLRK